MSRVGNKPIPIPDGVTISLSGRTVDVEGPVGQLRWTHRPEISVRIDEEAKRVLVERSRDDRLSRSLHGLTRSLISNMLEGCAKGYSRTLEVYGIGYGVQVQDNKFTMTCGLSHPVEMAIPPGLTVDVEAPQARGESSPAKFTVRGADKQAVGELAAQIRRKRPPEPYKGKGVRYEGERVRRKVGKAFASGAAV